MKISEDMRWLLSFYRTSEIGGALFFGGLAQRLRPGLIQQNMTRHFAEEAQHARYWSECMTRLDIEPLKLAETYQDRYLAAAGLPVNLMEILAITHVFERRVLRHYAAHLRHPQTPTPIASTLERIIADEKWHVQWVGNALHALESEYEPQKIRETLARYRAADEHVYRTLFEEHADRARDLLGQNASGDD